MFMLLHILEKLNQLNKPMNYKDKKLKELEKLIIRKSKDIISANTYEKYGKRYLGRDGEDMRYESLLLDLVKFSDEIKIYILKREKDYHKGLVEEIEGRVEELPNVQVETKRGNLETKITLKAKFTKEVLKILKEL